MRGKLPENRCVSANYVLVIHLDLVLLTDHCGGGGRENARELVHKSEYVHAYITHTHDTDTDIPARTVTVRETILPTLLEARQR